MEKPLDPLSTWAFDSSKKGAGIPVEHMDYSDLDDHFPSGYLDPVTRRDKFDVSRRWYSKRLGSTGERRCVSRIWIRSGKRSFTFLEPSIWGFASGWHKLEPYFFWRCLSRKIGCCVLLASQGFQSPFCDLCLSFSSTRACNLRLETWDLGLEVVMHYWTDEAVDLSIRPFHYQRRAKITKRFVNAAPILNIQCRVWLWRSVVEAVMVSGDPNVIAVSDLLPQAQSFFTLFLSAMALDFIYWLDGLSRWCMASNVVVAYGLIVRRWGRNNEFSAEEVEGENSGEGIQNLQALPPNCLSVASLSDSQLSIDCDFIRFTRWLRYASIIKHDNTIGDLW